MSRMQPIPRELSGMEILHDRLRLDPQGARGTDQNGRVTFYRSSSVRRNSIRSSAALIDDDGHVISDSPMREVWNLETVLRSVDRNK